jgi:acyl-CoA synthetase (AMP-forming)/AMP-acid ligase II/thioesterase domain-containing protein
MDIYRPILRPSTPSIDTEFRDATVATIIAEHVVIRPESPAIVVSKENVLSYGALGAQIAAFGADLRANGIGRSARVAIMLPDGPKLAVAIVAAACHAVAVPLNPKLTASELEELFATLRIDALVALDRIDNPVRDVAARHNACFLEPSSGTRGNLNILAGAAATSTPPGSEMTPRPDDAAVILRTSATTGRPKLVPLTHRILTSTAEKRALLFNLTVDDRALCAAPLYYSQALKGTLLTPLLRGGSVACPDSTVDRDALMRVIDLRPSWIAAGPVFFANLLERALARRGAPLHHSLRFMTSSAAPLSFAVRQGLEEVFGIPVLEGYGLTETGTVAANSITPEHRKTGTVGRPSPDEVAIRAEDGRLLPPGETGEIVVRGPGVMPGYLYNEEANRAAFVDGWFRTGDLGSIDAEGFLTLLGRLKDLINRGGEKISPDEIERALLLHPCVREAAAFSVPHHRLGQSVAAAVVLMPEAKTTPTEIKSFLFEHLAPFKIPQRVFVNAKLPRGATGKILRRQLSEEAAHSERDAVAAASPLHQQILEIWQRLIGRNDIGIDDDFFEAGGDSLLATQMICEVETVIRQRILPSALKAVFTIRELAALGIRGSPATAQLVTCAKQGRGTPLLFCHGDYLSRGFYALKLADMLARDQPVFLMHPHLDPEPQLTIEEMARCYVPQISAAHPTGALSLGGYCNGGLLAWEITHQLEQLGREVEFVALVDVPSLNARRIFRAIAHLNSFIAALAPRKISRKLALDGMRRVWRFSSAALAPRKIIRKLALDGMRRVWAKEKRPSSQGPAYSHAMSNYLPPKVAARIICVISDECRSWRRISWKPWTNLAAQVSCERVPGTHFSCVTKYASEVARVLDSAAAAID